MDYKCLVLLLCLSGAAAQSISVFPENPIGGMVGESVLIECGISNPSSVLWQKVDIELSRTIDIYNSIEDNEMEGYTVERRSEGGVEHYDLRINSATRDHAGYYTCNCITDNPDVAVLIFEPPAFMDNDDDQLVAGTDTTFKCEVAYGSPDPDLALFNFHMEDQYGNTIAEYNDTLDDTPSESLGSIEYRRIEYSNPFQLEWDDDGQEYACVISMPGGFEGNTTLPLSVLHKASNASLDPYDPDMIYVRNEDVTVVYSSNPYPAKEFRWYRQLSPGNWELVDGEEDNDATITINGDWPDSTTLKVEIINAFDHDADGMATDQMANYTFPITLSDSCGGSGASMLVTTLFALLATFFLQR